MEGEAFGRHLLAGAEQRRNLGLHRDVGTGHDLPDANGFRHDAGRSEEHTSELQSLMRISYAVFCLKKKKNTKVTSNTRYTPTAQYFKQSILLAIHLPPTS